MNLLKIIIIVGLGTVLISCGGQNDNQRAVEIAKVENGVATAKDGRMILSSESNALTIPSGQFEGVEINSAQLASIIEGEVKSISKVYNLSFKAGVSLDQLDESGDLIANVQNFMRENLPIVNKMIKDSPISIPFITSFSVGTHASAVYDGIECASFISESSHAGFQLELRSCGNSQVVLSKTRILVDMNSIVVDQGQIKARDVLE